MWYDKIFTIVLKYLFIYFQHNKYVQNGHLWHSLISVVLMLLLTHERCTNTHALYFSTIMPYVLRIIVCFVGLLCRDNTNILALHWITLGYYLIENVVLMHTSHTSRDERNSHLDGLCPKVLTTHLLFSGDALTGNKPTGLTGKEPGA